LSRFGLEDLSSRPFNPTATNNGFAHFSFSMRARERLLTRRSAVIQAAGLGALKPSWRGSTDAC
jgi:hypothetical protein